MAAEDTDVKPDIKQGPITIVVRAQNNSELAFKVKGGTTFSKIVNAYCKNKGINPKSVRFHNDGGERIDVNRTIAELDLDPEEDDDGEGPKAYVDAYLEQTGGAVDTALIAPRY
jgi:hypothetical protein